MSKVKLGIGVCVLLVLVALVLVLRQNAKLRAESEALQAQVADAKRAAAEPAAQPQISAEDLERLKRDAAEALKLRGEIAVLRRDRADAARLTEDNVRLRQQLQVAATEKREEDKRLTPEEEAAKRVAIAKLNGTRAWLLAFNAYAQQNQGQMPTDFTQARGFLQQDSAALIDPNLFEIVFHGSLQEIQDPTTQKAQDIIVVREREPVVNPDGTRSKAYAFADGHSEVRREPPEGFDAWEKSRFFVGRQP